MIEAMTRGPWKAVPWRTRFHIKTAWEGASEDQQHLVAEVVENREGPVATRANAHALEALPDLLALCESIVYFWESDPQAFGDDATITSFAGRFANIGNRARWVMNKANGVEEEV